MIKKKILIGSFFVAFLIVSISFISVAKEQQKEEAGYVTTSGVLRILDQLIDDLQYIHDYIAENHPEEFDQEFLAEFQENINALSDPGSTGFCVALLALLGTLTGLGLFFVEINPAMALLLASLANLVLLVGFIFRCWPYASLGTYETTSCGCTQQSQSTT